MTQDRVSAAVAAEERAGRGGAKTDWGGGGGEIKIKPGQAVFPPKKCWQEKSSFSFASCMTAEM